ncbi:MAG: hypothetical protein L0154_06835 [Chloroflexi bacterium]|nr:hypothetical protein [Chloroflexota bacterium]
MPADVTRPSDKAVVIATLTGHVTLEDMTEVYAQTLDLMRPGEDFVYRITDARQADSNFADMLKILMMRKEYGGATMPIYFEMDETYHHIDIHRQNRNRQMQV